MKIIFRKTFLIAFLAVLAGCAAQFENVPLAQGETNNEQRYVDVSHKDRPVILVALSGGGVRAADFGWVILQELRKTQYMEHGQPRRLIDDIAMVSSVSGGSVIAAYYGLYGAEGLDTFEPDFLVRDNMKFLFYDAASPVTWFDLALDGAGRSELIKDMFDERLFHGRTFGELNQPGRPFIVLNTTDMASGEIFSLTPGRFDDICSAYDKLPIAAGVAASSAVPVVLSPVAFQNYAATHCAGRPLPRWVEVALNGKYEPYLNVEAYKDARYTNDLRHGPLNFRDIQYLYLVDGGLADNLGMHSLLGALSSPRGTGDILRLINDGEIRKLAVIVVNAKQNKLNANYESPERPGVLSMIGSVASVPISSTSASVSAQMGNLLAEIKKAANGGARGARFAGMKVYNIQIDMDQLRGWDDYQRALRDKAKAIPTSWTISAEDHETVKEVGQLLLRQHPCFQKLLIDMKVDTPYIDREFAKTGCPG